MKELGKGRNRLEKKMLDETKLVSASIASEIRYTFPPKNVACKALMGEAKLIFRDIEKRGSVVYGYLVECEATLKGSVPGEEKAKSYGIRVDV